MAELADALDLGSSAVKGVQVQVLFPAPAHIGFYASCIQSEPAPDLAGWPISSDGFHTVLTKPSAAILGRLR
jgi:hypothetical protein